MSRKNTKGYYDDYVFSKDRLSVKITNCNITYYDKNNKLKARHNQNVSGYVDRRQLIDVKYEQLIEFILIGKIEVWGIKGGTTVTNESKIVFPRENPYK